MFHAVCRVVQYRGLTGVCWICRDMSYLSRHQMSACWATRPRSGQGVGARASVVGPASSSATIYPSYCEPPQPLALIESSLTRTTVVYRLSLPPTPTPDRRSHPHVQLLETLGARTKVDRGMNSKQAACLTCRRRKIKCRRDDGAPSCERCQLTGVECIIPEFHVGRQKGVKK